VPGTSQFNEQVAYTVVAFFDDTFSVGQQTTVAAFSNLGGRIDSIVLTSDDTIDHVVEFDFSQGGNRAGFGSINVPAGAGYGLVPRVEAMTVLAQAILNGVVIANFSQLEASLDVVMSTGKTLFIVAAGGSF
jgi:hypothetical protein